MGQHIFSVNHDLYYSIKEPAPIAAIVESLLGLETLIKMSPAALQRLTGVEISRVEVLVSHIESGSLIEKILVRFFFENEERMNQFIDKVRAKVSDKTLRNILISSVLLAMVYYGSKLLAESKNQSTTTISAGDITIINIGAGEVKMSPEEFRSVIESSITDKKGLAKSTLQILRPARSDSNASVEINGDDRLSIPAEVIRSVPHSFDIQPDTKVEIMEGAELYIRATNRDSINSGWMARVPLRFDKKLKLKLSDSINPEEIAGMAVIHGKIAIHYYYDPSTHNYEPDYLVLLGVTP